MDWIRRRNHHCKLRGWPRRPLPVICLIIMCIPFSHLVWKSVTLEAQWTSQPMSVDNISSFLKTNTLSEVNLEPAVDRMVKDYREQMLESLPNLPLRYGQKPGTHSHSGRNKCANYPSLFDICFNNIYWQVHHSSNGSFYLYSAFFDNRTLVTNKPSIRILGMIDRLKPTETHCQIWYDGKDAPVVSKVIAYDYMWYKGWGNYINGVLQPYLLQCAVPEEYKQEVPQSVSLVEKPCQKPTNNLRIIYNLPPGGQKEDFAVCMKGFDFSLRDNSLRIVEWLELVFILGANKVFLYDLGLHPNVSKILKYYESQGRVEITKLTLPAGQPNAMGLRHKYLTTKITNAYQNELIPYNDCLYKNIYRYKFITLLDVDEVIMPRRVLTWKSLMEQLAPGAVAGHNHTRSSYFFRNVYFLDSMLEAHGSSKGIPLFMHMLQHVYRAANYTNPYYYIKCFHDPERILTVHNHFPFACVGGGCSHLQVPTEVAHLQHYRRDCVGELRKVCPYFRNHTRLDTSVSRFRNPLIDNTLHTLRHLGFLKK